MDVALIPANVCVAVHVLPCPRFIEATAAPVVGEIVSVPSLLVIEETPLPLLPLVLAIIPRGEAVSVRDMLVAVKVPEVTNSRSVIPERLT